VPKGVEASSWPQEDKWLETLIRGQKYITLSEFELTALLDHKWWNLLSEFLNGLDESLMTKEWARIAAWLIENPRRRPTVRGWKLFVRSWLEKAVERERKQVPTKGRQSGWKGWPPR